MSLVAHTLKVEADRPTRDCYAPTPTPDGDDGASEPPKVVTVENRLPGTVEGILDLFSKSPRKDSTQTCIVSSYGMLRLLSM